jgi:excisionase family DNA binding protein
MSELLAPTLPPPQPDGAGAPLLLRVTEGAQLLGISRTSMYQLVATGQVPLVRIGKSVRLVRSGLEAWIRSSQESF